jgi:uncharacterized damage-inducible protein DinB
MKNLGQLFLQELEMEEKATRACLERIPESTFDWKPHPKSMQMGYLALLVADIPKWITAMIEIGEINFATWERYTEAPFAEMMNRFDANMAGAKESLRNASDDALQEGRFVLKSGDQVLMNTPTVESIASTINHLVHHRGQLTVYMRLNDILVPSIYGPSADEKTF